MDNGEQELIGRIRTLIAESDTNQTNLAAAIHISPSKMSLSMNGNRRFTTYELAAIADHFGTTVDFLVTGRVPAGSALAARDDSDKSPAWEAALSRAEELSEVGAALDELNVPTEPSSWHRWVRPTLSGRAIVDGPRLAEAAHSLLADENLAEDLPGAIERVFGIHVTAERLGKGFDGLACRRDSFRLILINTDVAWSRQRFTIAHELGHHLAGDIDAQGLIADDDVMAPNRPIAEMRANAFAAAVLMPRSALEAAVGSQTLDRNGFAALVGRFRVSAGSLAWRLKGLGLITPEQRLDFASMSPHGVAREGDWLDAYLKLVEHQPRTRNPEALVARALTAFFSGEVGAAWPAAILRCEPDKLYDAFEIVSSVTTDEQEPVFVP